MSHDRTIRYIIGSFAVGGTEKHLLQILPALKKLGWDIRLVSLSKEGELRQQFEQKGIKTHAPDSSRFYSWAPSPFRKIFKAIYLIFFLMRDYQKHPSSITHFFLPASYILGMIASFVTFDSSIKIMSRRSLNLYQQKYPGIKKLERYLHRFQTIICGNSKQVVAQLHEDEGVTQDKLRLIYNGIDLSPYKNAANSDKTRKELSIGSEALVITIVANLIPYKGHEDLLQALGLITKKLPISWKLLVIGRDDGLQKNLEKLAAKHDISEHILWLGQRDDVANLLTASDIAVLCSHEEGFSNAILEAMAAELPVIATDVGGNAEAVQHNKTGFIIPPKDPKSLSNAILKLSENTERRLEFAQNGKQKAIQAFGSKICSEQYDSLYQAAIS